jgi:hypothetical protein
MFLSLSIVAITELFHHLFRTIALHNTDIGKQRERGWVVYIIIILLLLLFMPHCRNVGVSLNRLQHNFIRACIFDSNSSSRKRKKMMALNEINLWYWDFHPFFPLKYHAME